MKKINDLNIFFNDRKEFHESLLRIREHNTIFNRDGSEEPTLTIDDLLKHSKKYPEAHIVMENPTETELRLMLADTKFYFSNETYTDIQPIFLFKKIISNEDFIVLCVNNEPDLAQFDEDEIELINRNGCYLTGKSFIELDNKNRESFFYNSDVELFGYWVDDFYFEENNWKSCFKGNQNYLNVFFSYKGNDSSTYILTPHY